MIIVSWQASGFREPAFRIVLGHDGRAMAGRCDASERLARAGHEDRCGDDEAAMPITSLRLADVNSSASLDDMAGEAGGDGQLYLLHFERLVDTTDDFGHFASRFHARKCERASPIFKNAAPLTFRVRKKASAWRRDDADTDANKLEAADDDQTRPMPPAESKMRLGRRHAFIFDESRVD